MGFVDKLKFWKKEDEFGDLGNLGDFSDFNLEEKQSPLGPQGTGLGTELTPSSSFEQGMGAQTTEQPLAMHPPGALDQQFGTPRAQSEGFGQMSSIQPMQAQYTQEQAPYGQPPMQPPARFEQTTQQILQPSLTPTQLGQQVMTAPMTGRFPIASEDLRHDLELLHSKLDTIKATLDSVNARLANLERIAGGTENRPRYQW